MPLNKAQKNLWNLVFEPVILGLDLHPVKGDEESLGTNIIMRDITRLIYNAEIMIADLTGLNPNVMYELGLAHAAKKHVIMIVQSKTKVPFDVNQVRYITYALDDLKKLKEGLSARIVSTLNLPRSEYCDMFPEIQFLNNEMKEELEKCRHKLISVELIVEPRHANVFFNDKLIDIQLYVIKVNPDKPRNTISVSAIGFIEHHDIISDTNIKERKIVIALDRFSDGGKTQLAQLYTRVPSWLRDRRRDPHNPVLMRAVSNYLILEGENKAALHEIEELLEIAPGWFMAINQMGLYYGLQGEYNKAEEYYRRTITANPNHFIGYFNLACVFSLKNDYKRCLRYLERIAGNEMALESIRESNKCLSCDKDFKNILNDQKYRHKFKAIEKEIFPDGHDIDHDNVGDSLSYITL